MALTQLEHFQATVAHDEHDGLFFYAKFTPDLDKSIRSKYSLSEEEYLREFFGMYCPEIISLKAPADYRPLQPLQYYEDIDIIEAAQFSPIGVLLLPGSMHHFMRYISPLRNAERFEQIENYPYPDMTGFSDDHMAKQVAKAHKQGTVTVGKIGHIYEDAWQIRGYEQFLMDMVTQRHWCEFILDKLTDRNLALAVTAAKAGVDWIETGDDVANQITLMFDIELWREIMKPRWAEIYSAVRDIKPDIEIWYHSDGNISDIIDDLIEIGVTMLNPVQPECLDPLTVKQKYGDKLVLDGTIGTQTTMPFATAEQVKETVIQRAESLGYDGALILSPTHYLEPEVPLENIEAFIEASKQLS